MSLKESIKLLQKKEHITQDEIFRRLGINRSSVIEHTSDEAIAAFQFAFGSGAVPKNANKKSRDPEKLIPWARKFPIRALQKMGHIPANVKDANLAHAVCQFMQVGGISGFNNYYSSTLNSVNPQTYAAWIRLGELRVQRLATDFTPDSDAIIANLKFLKSNVFLHGQKLRNVARESLLNYGIELIEVEPFLFAHAPTCAFYWRGFRPVIQFSTAPMDDSRFLEALFHAVAHVLFHPLRTTCLQLGILSKQANTLSEGSMHPNNNILEAEAEHFAQSMLLTEAEECELICCGRFNERRCIQHFSGVFHVRPSILVERLQQQGKISRRSPLNEFKIAV